MHAIVESRRAEIAAICERLPVKRLDVFGSAATGSFDPARSDVDFLVELEDQEPIAFKRAYFELKEALEHLLGRPVDLLTERALDNTHLATGIKQSREPLYGR